MNKKKTKTRRKYKRPDPIIDDLDYDILTVLSKNNSSVMGLVKECNTNHAPIKRHLNKLFTYKLIEITQLKGRLLLVGITEDGKRLFNLLSKIINKNEE